MKNIDLYSGILIALIRVKRTIKRGEICNKKDKRLLVVTKNTEERLFEDLQAYWLNRPTYRCLYLRLSLVQKSADEWLERFLIELRGVIEDKDVQVYICHDQDIFVVARTITQSCVEAFLQNLSPNLASALNSPGLTSLFEIGIDWPRLRALCEKKIEKLQLSRMEKNKAQKPSLPAVSAQKALDSINKDLLSSIGARRHKRPKTEIMVVEDDPFSQKLIGNALQNAFTLSITDDGAGALMNYVRKAPDVLFLDIGLPDIDGHEVLERLFKMDPEAYVIMFSGNGDQENVLKAVKLGAKGFVGKPFTKDKLFEYIEKSPFVRAKRSRDKVYEGSIH